MNTGSGRQARRLCSALVAVALSSGVPGSGAGAQFFTPSFQNYQTFAQRSVGFVAATVRPDFTSAAVQKALSPSASATPASYKYALSKTNFVFKGSPTQQKNCAAMVQKPVDRSQMATLCLKIFNAAQAAPEFHRNNLAAGLMLLIGASVQVSRNTELTEGELAALERGLNDVLVDAGVMRGKPAELQAMYETAVMTGGLIAGIAQSAAEDGNEDQTNLAKVLANTVLKGFGLNGAGE
ncbi:DUF6683 family protein [Deinococcus sp. UYEF24]